MRHVLLLSFTCYFLSLTGQASLEISKVYTIKDGLSNNTVLRVREDSRGFLWIGTWEGLNRFDGNEFKQYFHSRNNPNSLPHDLVWDILEYQTNMLLIATPNGLGVLNTLTGLFENDKIQFSELKAGSNTHVTKLEKDPEGNIWVNHDGEIDVFDKHLKYLYRFTDLDWTKSIKGISMYLQDWVVDQKGRMWISSDTSGIIIIDVKNKSIQSYKNAPEHLHYFSHRLIRSLILEGDSILWVSQWAKGIMKYNIVTGELLASLFYENENSFPEMIKLDNSNFLLGGFGDVSEFNPHTLENSSLPEYGLTNRSDANKIISSTSLCKTNKYTYWLGAAEGLFKVNMKIPKKEINLSNEPAWNSNTSWLISKSGNIFILGGEKWMLEIDHDNDKIKRYEVPLQMEINFMASIAEDLSGKIWIGGETGLRRFDPVTKTFDIPSFVPDLLKTGKIRVILCDRDGYLWVNMADPFHLFRISITTEEFLILPDSLFLTFSSTGPFGRINQINEDENGDLWLSSTIAGEILFHEKATNLWVTYPKSDESKAFLGKIGIKSMWPDTAGNIWLIRSIGDGIVHYNYRTDSITVFTREDGLLSNEVISIFPDGMGNLWISSSFGISRFSTTAKQITGHFLMDYASNGIDYGLGFDATSQKLILSGFNNIIWINPEDVLDTFPPPLPLLDGVTVNREIKLVYPSNPILNLNYTQNNISIAYTAINFSNTETLTFAHTLRGEDEEWTYTTSSPLAQYSLLSPGKYEFSVKVTDGSGEWSDAVNLLTFTIRPPFWKSIWFLLLLGLLLGFIIYILIQRRILAIRRSAQLKEKIVETEMMALRAQMNPHFIFNCINSIDSLIQSNDKYLATQYLNKFAKLIRNILDSSKINEMTLSKDLETLTLYIELEQFRAEHKFEVEIDIDPFLPKDDNKVPPLVIQPYVENAILHGLRNRLDNKGKLKITISRSNGYIKYVIEDNGVGRENTLYKNTRSKTSYGLSMSHERIKLFNEEEKASVDIIDLEEEGVPIGTRVVVLLKMK